ncbi:MAG: RNA methyltransferase, partial [Clostridia bacterium]|nr:RNA methyltransferase [Clostridia bacterium]
GNGLTDEAKRICDRQITIPITGRAESFNAAAAAAILLWELMK